MGSVSNDDDSTGGDIGQKHEVAVPDRSVTINGNDRTKDLNEHDVVCEKGRGDHERWPGNKLYRHLINVYKETYNELPPIERSSIIGKIITAIQEKAGWFVHHSDETTTWARLSEEKVRKKVSDDLRREIRRRREKRSNNSVFSAKLRVLKQMEEAESSTRDILEPVDDPRPMDVLFGPGARRHSGNKTYWNLMKMNLDQYIISPYGARSVISRNIVQSVRVQHGRFLEQDPKTGIWYSISDKRAIEKTSHALSNMKYKTRKRDPHDPVDYRGLAGPPTGPFGDMTMYDEDDFSEEDTKILDTDSPNTVFAKKRTKKFRFLSRRIDDDDDVTLESKDSLKSAGSLEGLMMLKHHQHGHPSLPTTPPVPGMSKFPPTGKVISPNDNSTRASATDESREDFHDYQEQRNPNNFRRGVPIPLGPPVGSEFAAAPAAAGYGVAATGGTEIGPRLSHYESYLKNYGNSNSVLSGVSYRPLSYDYGSPPPQPSLRRYGAAASGPDFMMGFLAAGGGVGGGGGPVMGPPQAGLSQLPPHGSGHIVKTSGPGGYWVSNEWAPRMEGYY